jgi:hypothetical protein
MDSSSSLRVNLLFYPGHLPLHGIELDHSFRPGRFYLNLQCCEIGFSLHFHGVDLRAKECNVLVPNECHAGRYEKGQSEQDPDSGERDPDPRGLILFLPDFRAYVV